MVCWNFQITKQTIEHKLWTLSRYKKSPLYKRIKAIRAISCIGIMLFLIGLEVYEVLSHYTLKPRIIFGFAIADFIVILLTWKLAPWATVKGELLSGTISGQLAALQGPHCITIADGFYRSYSRLDVGSYLQRNSSDLDEVVSHFRHLILVKEPKFLINSRNSGSYGSYPETEMFYVNPILKFFGSKNILTIDINDYILYIVKTGATIY